MSHNTFGSYIGSVTAGQNMVEVLRQKEEIRTTRKRDLSTGFAIMQLGISGPEGLGFRLNGERVSLPKTGVFQIGYGLVDIETLVFDSDATVNIVYIY